MSELFSDAMQRTMETSIKASKKADDAEDSKQIRSIIHTIYFRLYDEIKMLIAAKQSANEESNSNAYQLAQEKLDFVNELLSINGLEELAHRINVPEQQQEREENYEPLQKVEKRLLFINGVIHAFQYNPLAIPTGGKKRIKNTCLKDVRLFTESTFDSAWKVARTRGLVEMLENDKFKSG